jgi:hypothetical protein
MLIYVDGKLYNDSEKPVVLILSPQDRLDIIGMKPDENMVVTLPDGMTAEEQTAFMEAYKVAAHEKAHEMEKQGKQIQPTLPGF